MFLVFHVSARIEKIKKHVSRPNNAPRLRDPTDAGQWRVYMLESGDGFES